MEQLNESELRFIQLEHEKTALHEQNDSLLLDLGETKKQIDNRIGVDYYLFTMVGVIVNLFEILRAAIWGVIRYFWQEEQRQYRGGRGRHVSMDPSCDKGGSSYEEHVGGADVDYGTRSRPTRAGAYDTKPRHRDSRDSHRYYK